MTDIPSDTWGTQTCDEGGGRREVGRECECVCVCVCVIDDETKSDCCLGLFEGKSDIDQHLIHYIFLWWGGLHPTPL